MFLVLKPPFILIIFGEKVESTSPTYGRFLSILNSYIIIACLYIYSKNKKQSSCFNIFLIFKYFWNAYPNFSNVIMKYKKCYCPWNLWMVYYFRSCSVCSIRINCIFQRCAIRICLKSFDILRIFFFLIFFFFFFFFLIFFFFFFFFW